MTEVIAGTVSKLRGSIEVNGGYGEHAGTSTTHITTFQLGDRAMRFRSTTLPAFYDGDLLMVAGSMMRNGQFDVLAFRNKTNGVTGDATNRESWMFAIVVMAMGFGAMIYGLASKTPGHHWVLVLGPIAIGLSIFLMILAARPKSAATLLS